MARNEPMIHFRLPADLKAWVEEQAAENGRSTNAELVWMIGYVKAAKESFETEERSEAAEAKRIAEEALKIAQEAQVAWQYNALMTGISPPKQGK